MVSQNQQSSVAPDAARVRRKVLAWYESHSRPLPWRDPDTTPWAILLSEVMSQQTPVARLIPTWQRWLQRWPTPAALAAASRSEVIREWGTLGYPRRALWLQQAATAICANHEGEVPASYEALIALPGIGDYTACAVCAFAFGQSIPVMDTNVRRVLARVFDGRQRPTASSPTRAEREFAARLLPKRDGATWSVAVMEYGSLVCQAARPRCDSCVIAADCEWKRSGWPVVAARHQQRFAGTDRQVRGKIMKVLRESDRPVTAAAISQTWPDAAQRQRCLESLLADGLVEAAGKRFRLPS